MTDFAVFAQQIIDKLMKEGRKHTEDTRKHSANRILMFMGDSPTSMDKWDELFVQDYEAWMKAQGLTASTTAYYLSQLCTFYKQAVKSGIIQERDKCIDHNSVRDGQPVHQQRRNKLGCAQHAFLGLRSQERKLAGQRRV